MVKIAIAGASSQLAREVLDALVATGKHEILALVRKDPAQFPALPGVTWTHTTYEKNDLIEKLRGTHTVLCFFLSLEPDPEGLVQKVLVDAAVEAGVKRYAPSEWQTGHYLRDVIDWMPAYASKLAIRDYLQEINREKKVLEYSLFQDGHFMNYLTAPHKTTTHVSTFPSYFDLDKMHAVLDADHKDMEMCFTAISDIAGVVAQAVEYEGEWPRVGGFAGTRITVEELVALIEQVKGKSMTVDWVKSEDYLKGDLKSDWRPRVEHPALANMTEEQYNQAMTGTLIGLLAFLRGKAWVVSDEWNRLLPDYKFTQVEDLLKSV